MINNNAITTIAKKRPIAKRHIPSDIQQLIVGKPVEWHRGKAKLLLWLLPSVSRVTFSHFSQMRARIMSQYDCTSCISRSRRTSNAPAPQRRCHQRPSSSVVPLIDLCSALADRFPTHPLSTVRSFHRKNEGRARGQADLPPHSSLASSFRYCVDDDSFKKCHRSSAGACGEIGSVSICCGQVDILPARIALPCSFFVGLKICRLCLFGV